MENRAILAAILMVGLLLLYQALFAPFSPPPPLEHPPAKAEPTRPTRGEPPPPPPPKVERTSPVRQRTTVVETPLYRAVVANDGGRLLEWVLNYRGDKPIVVPGALASRGLSVHRAGSEGEVLAFSEVGTTRLSLEPERPRGRLRLVGQDAFGLEVSEELEFQAEDYAVEAHIAAENRHTVRQVVELLLPWSTLREWSDEEGEAFQGQHPTRVVWLGRDGVHREDVGEVTKTVSEGRWIGLESEWYITALVPRSPGFKLVVTPNGDGVIEVGLKAAPPPLAPGERWEGRVVLYLGPKEYDRLEKIGAGLEQSINVNLLWWIFVPLLRLMNFLYGLIPNYGVAIILVTVITKTLFYPLTYKGMMSMRAMQKKMHGMQPELNALKAKHQKDPKRLQQEQMDLYKKHGVNPLGGLGGCLPMVVQMPIFLSLYWVFSLAVELQNAPFLCFGTLFGTDLWICDLAQRDPTYVLPILMGVSMFVQQKMTPVVGDPRQAKMMQFMPVMFTFFFLNLPSGLVLYWCVSNILQIMQQYYIDRWGRPVRGSIKPVKGAQRA